MISLAAKYAARSAKLKGIKAFTGKVNTAHPKIQDEPVLDPFTIFPELMKFGLRNTSFVYPNGIVEEYAHVGADQLCLDFAKNDPESYALFVEEVMRKFS